jgi:uncharacterized protein
VSSGFLANSREGILLTLRVSPGARRTSLEGPYGENALKLRVAAPPEGGKANAEIEVYLARLLAIPRSNVSIVRGASGRDKTVLVRAADPREARNKLLSACPPEASR